MLRARESKVPRDENEQADEGREDRCMSSEVQIGGRAGERGSNEGRERDAQARRRRPYYKGDMEDHTANGGAGNQELAEEQVPLQSDREPENDEYKSDREAGRGDKEEPILQVSVRREDDQSEDDAGAPDRPRALTAGFHLGCRCDSHRQDRWFLGGRMIQGRTSKGTQSERATPLNGRHLPSLPLAPPPLYWTCTSYLPGLRSKV